MGKPNIQAKKGLLIRRSNRTMLLNLLKASEVQGATDIYWHFRKIWTEYSQKNIRWRVCECSLQAFHYFRPKYFISHSLPYRAWPKKNKILLFRTSRFYF